MYVKIAGRVTLRRGGPFTVDDECWPLFPGADHLLPAFCVLRADKDAIGNFWSNQSRVPALEDSP